MSEHALLAPSSAFRWGVCALSASLEAAYPETEPSPASLEGTAAHWVVQRVLEGHPPVLNEQVPNGCAVTQEMLEGADLVMETIEHYLGSEWRNRLVIERKVQIPRIHPLHCWGTPDLYAWGTLSETRRILHLFDYKFGYGFVRVEENPQLTAYASGLISDAGLDEKDVLVQMVIIQPRAYSRFGAVRLWRSQAVDLRVAVERLRAQGAEALGPKPTATPEPAACEDCKGQRACEALQKSAYVAADKGQQAQAVDLTPLALGRELRALKRAQTLLNARVSGLEAQAEATIRQGAHVPFWMLESNPGRLKWSKPIPEVLALGQMLGKDLAAPTDAITPTQAKKRGMPESLVDAYATRTAGATKLVIDDGTKARLTFGSSNT